MHQVGRRHLERVATRGVARELEVDPGKRAVGRLGRPPCQAIRVRDAAVVAGGRNRTRQHVEARDAGDAEDSHLESSSRRAEVQAREAVQLEAKRTFVKERAEKIRADHGREVDGRPQIRRARAAWARADAAIAEFGGGEEAAHTRNHDDRLEARDRRDAAIEPEPVAGFNGGNAQRLGLELDPRRCVAAVAHAVEVARQLIDIRKRRADIAEIPGAVLVPVRLIAVRDERTVVDAIFVAIAVGIRRRERGRNDLAPAGDAPTHPRRAAVAEAGGDRLVEAGRRIGHARQRVAPAAKATGAEQTAGMVFAGGDAREDLALIGGLPKRIVAPAAHGSPLRDAAGMLASRGDLDEAVERRIRLAIRARRIAPAMHLALRVDCAGMAQPD